MERPDLAWRPPSSQSMPMCPPHEARLLSSSPRINYRIRHLERERWALPRAGSSSKTTADEWGAACSELVRGYGQPPREATGAAGTSLVLAWVMLYGIFVRIHVVGYSGVILVPGIRFGCLRLPKSRGVFVALDSLPYCYIVECV